MVKRMASLEREKSTTVRERPSSRQNSRLDQRKKSAREKTIRIGRIEEREMRRIESKVPWPILYLDQHTVFCVWCSVQLWH